MNNQYFNAADNASGTTVLHSDAAEKIFCQVAQYSREELIPALYQLIHDESHVSENFRMIWETIDIGKVWRSTIQNHNEDGTSSWMEITIVPLMDVQVGSFQYMVLQQEVTRQQNSGKKGQELSEDIVQHAEALGTDIMNAMRVTNFHQSQEIRERKLFVLELKQSLKHEKLIKNLIQVMSRSFDSSVIMAVGAQEIGAFFKVDRCLLMQYEKKGAEIQRMNLSAQYCRSEDIRPVQAEDVPWDELGVMHHPGDGGAFVIFNASSPKYFPPSNRQHLETYGVQSALALEIVYRDISFGRLVLHQCTFLHTWTQQEIDFLEMLIQHIGSALYQAQLYQKGQQAKELAEKINQEKTRILSYVSHDFKNPLDGISWLATALNTDDTLSPKHKEMIGQIAQGVTHLRAMVTNILDKARLEEGQMVFQPELIPIQAFIGSLIPLFDMMGSSRSVELSIEIQPELTLTTDPTSLRQILINLISNAAKYNRPGGLVFLRLYQSDKRQLVVEVQDTGIGIPPEKMPQLFTEYYRTDLSESNPVEGSGLGLAFIKKLVELQGGTITVESQAGIGSTFRVVLPLLQ